MQYAQPIDPYFINQIKKLRKEAGLSQMALAKQMCIGVGFIGKVESPNYTSIYNLKHINTVAGILKCSPKDLLPKQPIKR